MIVPSSWSLPESVRSRISPTTYGKQRAIVEEGHLVLVLHKLPGPDDSEREGVLYWRNPAGEWFLSKGGPAVPGLKKHIQEYVALEDELTDRYECAHDTSTLFEILEAASPAARAARNMHQALQAAREQVGNDPVILELRDLSSDVDRNFELLLEDVRHALQYRTAKEAEEQARTSREALRANHRLNILVALFLPLTAIGGIFGMNLSNGLENGGFGLFWVILTMGLVLGAGLVGWVLARPKPELPQSPALPPKAPPVVAKKK